MSGESEPATQPDAPSVVGRLLAGRYRLQQVLGEGGMAIVYEGEHVALGKRVAIKLVHSLLANDDDTVRRFEREARSASAVESEHIVHVFDVGADPDLGLFLVMELLKGEDLARVLARRTRLDPVFASGLVKQATLGLEKAHAAGIVHRDLKPANIFLVERDDGTTLVKLVDFGIAKIVRDAEHARFDRKGITRRGTAIGTPQYMSPEQAQALETVDHRTDVFSLGAVLFEVIAGQPYLPERPTYEQTILQLMSTTAPRLSSVVPSVPRALDDLVAEMLEHDVSRRVSDMRAVRERLEAIYPELAGTRVKLRSLPPAALAAVGHTVRGIGAPPKAAGVETLTAIEVPKTSRRVLYLAALAIAVGLLIGVATMWSRRTELPAAAAHGASSGPVAANAVQAGLPGSAASGAAAPADRPTSSAPTETQAASLVAPASPIPSAIAAPLDKPAAAGKTSPAPSRPGRSGAGERPGEQVGAAGISSQF